MRILLVVTKGEMGGAQKRIIDLATQYKEAGHTVTVASGPGSYLPAELAGLNIDHIYFKDLSRDKPLKIFMYMYKLWRHLQTVEYDVVHFNSSSALAGALVAQHSRSHPRVVFTFRGLSILAPGFKTGNLKERFYRASYRFFLPFVDVGVFQCAGNQKTLHEVGLGLTHEAIIADGIDRDRVHFMSAENARQELQYLADTDLSGKKIVGSIGRLSYAKNYAFLIRQMKKLAQHRQDVACIIVGDGPERASLEYEIERLGLEGTVFLVGERKQAAELMRGFDLFVLPSRYEGLSMSLSEALHAGTPMLVSDVGCAASIVPDQRMLFHADDAAGFIDQMQNLLNTQDKEALSAQIRQSAANLVVEKSASDYLNLYHADNSLEEVVVLHFITGLESGGGAETFLTRVLPQLNQSKGVRHVVCAMRPIGEAGERLKEAGVEVRSLDMHFKFDPRAIFRYKHLLHELRPVAQINYLIHADIFGRIFGHVFSAGKIISFIRNKHQDFFSKFAEVTTMWLVDCLLTNSWSSMDYYRDNYRIPACNYVIANGIPLPDTNIDGSYLYDSDVISKDDFIVTSVARLHEQKSLDTLVEAVASLKQHIHNIKLLLVGDGKEQETLEQLALDLGIGDRVIFTGQRDDVDAILTISDIFVLPSEKEGMSNALLEAMAEGLPCVVSDIPENIELIADGEAGLTFMQGDAPDLARQIEKLHDDPQLRVGLGANAQARVQESYTLDQARDKFQHVIDAEIL